MSKEQKSKDLVDPLDDAKMEDYKMRIHQYNQFNVNDIENIIGQSLMSELLFDILRELREIKELLSDK